MSKNRLLLTVALFTTAFAFAQEVTPTGGGSALKTAAQKIEGTVPFVVKHLEEVSKTAGDNNILAAGKMQLQKEYSNVSQEFNMFKENMVTCIADNKSSKKMKKCMNYNSDYFRSTLLKYDNYVKHVTKENGFAHVGYNKAKDFNPIEIVNKIDEEYVAMTGKIQRMKGDERQAYIKSLNSSEFSLQKFDTVNP